MDLFSAYISSTILLKVYAFWWYLHMDGNLFGAFITKQKENHWNLFNKSLRYI